MNPAVDARDLERFRAAVGARLGLHFDDTKLAFLADVLQQRVDASGKVCGRYLDRLETLETAAEELRALARELTVAETYFFRNIDQFRAFAEAALPDRLGGRSTARKLRILSAGCASGEEPYSLAILVRELLADRASDVSIRAVDVNPETLEKAARARYSAWSLRETPSEIQRRWFRAERQEYCLDEGIRTEVEFEERNVAVDDPDLWEPESYDVVFCRNLLMYFTPEAARSLVARITGALASGGYLFLGHAETLRGLSHDYHLRHTHGTFYYQRRGMSHGVPAGAPPPAWSARAAVTPAPDVGAATTWVETIQRAARRIQTLSERSTAPSGSWARSASAATAAPVADLDHAVELLKQERFTDALERLRGLPPESARDPDVLLLRAALLAESGELGAAERVCEELLALDELNAGAHYLLALCREGAGDRRRAADHDQTAVYLDPSFAMPRLHLGLLARRAGNRETARRELGQALLLLQREDPPRLLLFGGGFSREALMVLCRAELVASGGQS